MAGLRTLLKPNEKVSIVAISPDSVSQNKEVAEKTLTSDGKGKLNAPFLSDIYSHAISAYGLLDARYSKIRQQGVPQPAIVLINRNGKIAWSSVGRHVGNTEIRTAIDALR